MAVMYNVKHYAFFEFASALNLNSIFALQVQFKIPSEYDKEEA
jgi:hypothetical protein